MIANARMYCGRRRRRPPRGGRCSSGWSPRRRRARRRRLSARRNRCRRCGRARISAARSCAAIRSRTPRRGRRFSPRRCRARAAMAGSPIYWTDLVVAADSPIAELPDARSASASRGPTEDSQSGWHAPRLLLAPYARRHGAPLFAETVGPLVTPRNVALAVAEGRADVGPLDSYAHDLLRRHEPALAARLRVIARTSGDAHSAARGRPWHGRRRTRGGCGRRSLPSARAPGLAAARETLLLSGFAAVAAERLRRAGRGRASRRCARLSADRLKPAYRRAIDTPRLRVKNAAFPSGPPRCPGDPMNSPSHRFACSPRRPPPFCSPPRPRSRRSRSARRTSPSSSSSPSSTRRRSKPRASRSSARSTSAAR